MSELDPKLKTKQLFHSRCLYCQKLNTYVARDTDVNTNLTDDDIYSLSYRVGKIEAEWCDNCNKKTAQMEVAYDLATKSRAIEQVKGGSDDQ